MENYDDNYTDNIGNSIDTDFNLDDEYKEDPLAPQGNYTGVVKKVSFEPNNNAILWTVVASGNHGTTLLDGSTPLDGTIFFYRNWLPKKGDENVRTKSGKTNKRQSKINMMKKFQEGMQINMNTGEAVKEAIMNSEWIGIPVIFELKVEEYEGRTKNAINKMVRSDEDIPMPYEDDEPAF